MFNVKGMIMNKIYVCLYKYYKLVFLFYNSYWRTLLIYFMMLLVDINMFDNYYMYMEIVKDIYKNKLFWNRLIFKYFIKKFWKSVDFVV